MKRLANERPSIVVAYVLIVLVAAFGFFRLEQQQVALCRQSQRKWDVSKSLSEILTGHAVIAPNLTAQGQSFVDAFKVQIEEANDRKDDQREQLAREQGPRPKC